MFQHITHTHNNNNNSNNDNRLPVHQEAVDEVDEVSVSESAHHFDLGDDELFLGLPLQVHLLDGHHLARSHARRHDDRPRRPVTIATTVTTETSVITALEPTNNW